MAKVGNKSFRRSEKKNVMKDHLNCNQKLNAYSWSPVPSQHQSAAATANQEISSASSARILAVTRAHYLESTKAMT